MLKSVNGLASIRFAVYLCIIITDPLTPTTMKATTAQLIQAERSKDYRNMPDVVRDRRAFIVLAPNGRTTGVQFLPVDTKAGSQTSYDLGLVTPGIATVLAPFYE